MSRVLQTKPLKVLLCAHVGYPWGGISQRYSDLMNSTLPSMVQLSFLESSPNKRSFSTTGLLNLENIRNSFLVIFQYLSMLIRKKPDIVHIATAQGSSFFKNSLLVLIGHIFGSKVILAPHCSISIFVPKAKLSLAWMKFVLRRCDGLIVLSSEWGLFSKIAPDPKVKYLKNAIDLSKYTAIKRIADNSYIVRIIFLGHIGEEKGVFDLLQAAELLANQGILGFEILMYGETLRNGELDWLINVIHSKSLDHLVRILPPVHGEEKIKVFTKADIFTLPSHHEGMPISIIEAMAAGLPVVGTATGGIPDLIEDNYSGYIVEVNSPEQLASALSSLISNHQLRYAFGVEGRKRAVQFHDINKYTSELVNFYQSVQNEKKNLLNE